MDDNTKEELLIALSVSLGALFFATVLTLLVARYYKQIRKWFLKRMPWLRKEVDLKQMQEEQRKDAKTSRHGDNKSRASKSSSSDSRRNSRFSSGSGSTGNEPKSFHPVFVVNQETEFTIPGSTAHQVQPIIKEEIDFNFSQSELAISSNGFSTPPSSPSSRKSSVSSSPGTSQRKSVASFSSNTANSPSLLRKAISAHALPTSSTPPIINEDSPKMLRRFPSMDELSTEDNRLRPELYLPSRRRTVGLGNLGKIRFSLQFEDKTKKKLNLFLHRLDKLQFTRPEITEVFVNVILLPERESIYHTKRQSRRPSLVFDEQFIFSSRPLNRDFESKTVRFVVTYVDKSSKEIPYGESRMPLLSREIYSQVQTDVSLNIKPFPQSTESGDLLVQLVFAADTGTLSVMFKCLKFPSSSHSENLTGIQIKSYVKRHNDRRGRKHTVSRPVAHGGSIYVEVNEQYKYKIPKEQFKESTLKINVMGKHKILGRTLSLGKVLIGDSSRDETGVVHWRTVCTSPGLAWTVWHPVYAS